MSDLPSIGGSGQPRTFRAWLGSDDAIHAKLLLSAVSGFVVILALVAVFLMIHFGEKDAGKLRDLSSLKVRALDRIKSEINSLDALCRGYAVSGADVFRDQYIQRNKTLRQRLDELTDLTAGDPKEISEVVRVRENMARWHVRFGEPLIERKIDGAQKPGDEPIFFGHVLLEETRGTIERLLRMESEKMRKFSFESETRQYWQLAGLGGLALIALALLGGSSIYSYRAYLRHLARVENAQAQLRSILDHTLDGLLTANTDGVVTVANPAAERLFGAPADAIVGRRIDELVPRSVFSEPLDRLGSGRIETEARRIDRPQETFAVEISLSDVMTSGRRQFIVLIRDITERRRTEESLRLIGLGVGTATGDEFVHGLVTRLSQALQVDCAFIVELEGEGNDTIHIMTMAEKGTICGSGPCDLSGTACEEVVHRGFKAYLSGVQERFPCDWLVAAFAAESFVCMPLADHSGNFIGLLGVLDHRELDRLDIVESTLQIFAGRAAGEIERKRSERSLASEKERLAVTLSSIGDACITVDTHGRILLFNPVAERLTGWTEGTAIGAPLSEIVRLCNVRSRRPIHKALDKLVATGSATELAGATLITALDGSERVVETNASPLTDPHGNRVGSVLVLRDVTERFRTMEERQKAEKLESLGIAAGGIAHDFNNLLTAILGNLSLVLNTEKFAETTEDRLSAAKRASIRAQELAQQLLTFAKGGAPIKQAESIGALVHDTVTFHLRGSKVACDFHIPDDIWPAEVDAGQISQVIQNLAINADQAMPAGGNLRVACANIEVNDANSRLGLAPGRWIKISVQDEGIGIPEENLKKIFDPYFTTKPKGSGLGLATGYSIVKAHGGAIDVVSQPGEGTVFYVFLPASEKAVAKAEQKTPPPAATSAGVRILVLDDEEAICILVECALQPLGYEVVAAQDSNTAIRLYAEALQAGQRFDLVISDLTIPGSMSGHEAVAKMREIDPTVRAMVSSGYAMDPVMSRYREHGFCAMIAKPYETDALARVVAAALALTDTDKVICHDFAAGPNPLAPAPQPSLGAGGK